MKLFWRTLENGVMKGICFIPFLKFEYIKTSTLDLYQFSLWKFWKFWACFFKKVTFFDKKVPFLVNIEHCPKFLEYTLSLLYSWYITVIFYLIVPSRFFILPGNQYIILTSKVSNKYHSSKEIFYSGTQPTFNVVNF